METRYVQGIQQKMGINIIHYSRYLWQLPLIRHLMCSFLDCRRSCFDCVPPLRNTGGGCACFHSELTKNAEGSGSKEAVCPCVLDVLPAW